MVAAFGHSLHVADDMLTLTRGLNAMKPTLYRRAANGVWLSSSVFKDADILMMDHLAAYAVSPLLVTAVQAGWVEKAESPGAAQAGWYSVVPERQGTKRLSLR
jgi:hypothetical protein